jgi:ribA/ribD-fused uncharacterized protein
MTETDINKYTEHTLFYNKSEVFSQWHPSDYSKDDVKLCCAEQGMMYDKARLFNAPETAQKILDCTPNEQAKMKSLGRKGIPLFDEKVWKKHRKQIVKDNSLEKYRQNANMRKALFDSKGTLLVEASPYDAIWGIGYNKKDALVVPKSKWGENLLGKILTEVREELLKEFTAETAPHVTPSLIPPIPLDQMPASAKRRWKKKLALTQAT